MNPVAKRRRSLPTLLSTLLLFVAASVSMADPQTGREESAEDDHTLREQTVYIPYAKLREVFEREGRGVFLPYEQFQALWRAAREAKSKPPERVPPFAALITEVHSEATVTQDVVRVVARVAIEVLANGWHEIPLRLGDAAITAATIGGQPARIVAAPGGGYSLLLEKKGDAPQQVELALEYVKAFTKSPGRNSVSFDAPRAPVSRWLVRIPETGVKVNIHPLIAAAEVPVDDAEPERPGETVILAFVGAAPSVRIEWTPRGEGATGLQALVTVRADQRVWILEGMTRTRTTLTYDISRAALDKLVLEVPTDQKVVNVFDANIRQWSVEQAGDVQRITVDLFEPAQGSQNVLIELERFGGDDKPDQLRVPVVRAVDAGRQQGTVAVAVAEGLRAETVSRTGLVQTDAATALNIPADSAAVDEWTMTYRYVTLPFELALRVERVLPRVIVDSLVEARLEPQSLNLHLQAIYDIQKAGIFRLELEIPAGYQVRSVRGLSSAGAQPVAVESHQVSGEDRTHLLINLVRQARGRVGLAVSLQKRLKEPDLMKPTGNAAEIAVAVPRISGGGIERSSGRLIVYAPESLRVNPARIDGLREVPLAEALQGMESLVNRQSGTAPSAAGRFAFVFAEEPVSLVLKVERRKPHITVRQFLRAKIEAGVVKYEATFIYDILYSGVEALRIDIPEKLIDAIHISPPGVRQIAIDPPPTNLADGYVAWSLRGETGFQKGTSIVRLAWESKIDALAIGKSGDIPVPRLAPAGVDRAWGQIALEKAETIDIHPAGADESELPAGLRPIDPQHDLMKGVQGVQAGNVARAFEFHDDWSLTIAATRYKLEEIKRTSIERAVVRMVATRSGQLSAQALYRVRSARQRLPVELPANVEFDTDPVRINGKPVPLERGQQNEFFIPLSGRDAGSDEPFVLEIRYMLPEGGTRFECPAFPSEPAVQKVYLCAFVPSEWALLGSRGAWSDELNWRWRGFFGYRSYAGLSDAGLISWVTAGVAITGNPAETFQTDGRLYVYSTLRPSPPPGGALSLMTLNENLLSLIVFSVLLVGGFLLLRANAGKRFFGIGGLITLLVLMGVFFPTFSRQVIDGVLISAIFVVLLAWAVRYMAWTRPRDPAVIARAEAREQARLARIRAAIPQPVPAGAADRPADSSENNADRSDQGEGGKQDD